MTWLAMHLLKTLHVLPLAVVRAIGALLGAVLYALAAERRRVANANLAACFPELDRTQRARRVRATFRSFGQGLTDRGILWYGTPERIRAMVQVEGEEHLAALAGTPVILLAPHFVGLDAGWTRLALDRRLFSIYARQKNPAADKALLAGRKRFNQPELRSRQDGLRGALRAMADGLPFYYLPDMDFGARHAVFVPFFGVPAATVTALSRLSRLAGALVLPCVTRMTGAGYTLRIDPPWTGFPGPDLEADTRRVNAFIEAQVRAMPEQYHWLHKRFKTRPPGAKPFYPKARP